MTPQSVNLDFQSGIMADTIAFGNVRWVQWSKFAIRPAQFAQVADALGPLVGRPVWIQSGGLLEGPVVGQPGSGPQAQ